MLYLILHHSKGAERCSFTCLWANLTVHDAIRANPPHQESSQKEQSYRRFLSRWRQIEHLTLQGAQCGSCSAGKYRRSRLPSSAFAHPARSIFHIHLGDIATPNLLLNPTRPESVNLPVEDISKVTSIASFLSWV